MAHTIRHCGSQIKEPSERDHEHVARVARRPTPERRRVRQNLRQLRGPRMYRPMSLREVAASFQREPGTQAAAQDRVPNAMLDASKPCG